MLSEISTLEGTSEQIRKLEDLNTFRRIAEAEEGVSSLKFIGGPPRSTDEEIHLSYTDPRWGIIGSAKLSPIMPGHEEYVLSECLFHIEEKTGFFKQRHPDSSEIFQKLMRDFYSAFEAYLWDFAQKNNLSHVHVTLDEDDFEDLDRLSSLRLVETEYLSVKEGAPYVILGIIDFKNAFKGIHYGTS